MTVLSDGKGPSLPKLVQWPSHIFSPAELLKASRHKTGFVNPLKSPAYSKIVLQVVGSFAYLLTHVLNKTTVFNANTFNDQLKILRWQTQRHNEKCAKPIVKAPLLTFSNHISCIDDPALWGALFPFTYYSRNTDTVRWTGAAVDICFSKPWHSTFFSLGKTFPIVRGLGVNQPAMEFASALLSNNQWLHLFPEGKVMRDHKQQPISNRDRGYSFRWGISKLIMDFFANAQPNSEKFIRILPFYHLGLDEILPIGWPYVPRFGKKVTIFMKSSAIELNYKRLVDIIKTTGAPVLRDNWHLTKEEVDRIKLTRFLENELETLQESAVRLHATKT